MMKTAPEEQTAPPVTMTFFMPNGEIKEYNNIPMAQARGVCRETRAEQLEQYHEEGIILKPIKRH